MKFSKRLLSLLLALVMTVGVMPAVGLVSAVDATDRAEQSDTFMRVLHLDCGRKYFTKDWIIALLNEMASAGYTHLQLAFGNDGLRFLLDDMSVTAGGTNYSSADVTAGIQAGNEAYYDAGDKNELTQTEMDEIIAYANRLNIGIIPLLNTPGHMDAIIDCMEYVNVAGTVAYNGSARTVNLENDSAVAFTKALVQKYIDYFAQKGCKYFHMGADEYANDAGGGFASLTYSGKYGLFGAYVNDLASMIIAEGMTPEAFNDGIYYNENTATEFNTNIVISYWSSGWNGYDVASAEYLANKGFPMNNTHGDYYFIIKSTGATAPTTSPSNFNNTQFMGSTVSNPLGSTFCVWSDSPGAATETQVAEVLRISMREMAAAMQGTTEYSTDVVAGGFNADGSLNNETPVNNVTLTDETTGISLTGSDLTSFTVTETTAPAIIGAAEVIAWDIVPQTADGKYESSGTVKIPIPAGWDSSKVSAFVVEKNGAVTTITGKPADGYYEFICPHFSTVGLSLSEYEDTVNSETTTVPVTKTVYKEVTGSSLDAGGKYLIVSGTNALSYSGSGYASATVTITDANAEIGDSDLANALWTYQNGGFYNEERSVYIDIGRNSLSISRDQSNITVEFSNGSCELSKLVGWIWQNTYYVTYDSGWTSSTTSASLKLYKQVSETDETTTTVYKVNPELQEARITALTVENDGYTDASWSAYNAALSAANTKLAEVQEATYSSESNARAALNALIALVDELETAKNNLKKAVSITVNYIADGVTVKTETLIVAEDAKSVTLNAVFTAENGTKYSVENTTLALTAGVTSYEVTVSEVTVNLDNVSPISIEYWQTNGIVVDTFQGSNSSYSVQAEDAYSANGISLDFLPQSAYTKNNTTDANISLIYWRCRLLDRSTNVQTTANGDDETLNGVSFTKIRYWNDTWAVYTENNEWVSVNSTDYQLVAYYMNDMHLANEIGIGTADWGKKGDGTLASQSLDSNHVSIAFQIIYEDGTTSPASTSASDLASYTYLVNNWNPRGVGTISFTQIADYQIWKITAETGTHTTKYTSQYSAVYVTNFSWDNNEETVYEGDPVSEYTIVNPAKEPSTEGAYANLTWDETNESILIRVYVKTVATEDTLTVHYIDRTANDEFYNYNISVAEGTHFDAGFALAEGQKNTLENNTVENYFGATQTVSANLTTMPQISAQYRYSQFKCVSVERSADGKEVFLYYTFENDHYFVADFGLPITITQEKLGINITSITSAMVAGIKYGEVTVNNVDKSITYTPNEIFVGIESIILTIEETGTSTSVSHHIYIIPASTVYYEDSFIEFSGSNTTWTVEGTASTPTQAAEELGNSSAYGSDAAYADSITYSLGSAHKVTVNADSYATARFTFSGTGFDIISLTSNTTGTLLINVQGTDYDKNFLVDTYYGYTYNADTGKWVTTDKGALYQIPVMKVTDLAYGTYNVTVTAAYGSFFDHTGSSGSYDLYIDAVRIYNPLGDSANDTYYKKDGEGWPKYAELRDMLISAAALDDVTGAAVNGAVFIDGKDNADIADYTSYGPNNEVYLSAGQAVSFTLGSSANVADIQIAMKSVNGEVNYKIYDTASEAAAVTAQTLNTATDMYYSIKAFAGKTVVIANTGAANILSITNIKVTYTSDPSVNTDAKNEPEALFTVRRSSAMLAASTVPIALSEAYVPEKFDVSVNRSTVKAGDTVSVTVKTSDDVAYITVNGEKITEYKYNAWTGERVWKAEVKAENVGELSISVRAYSESGAVSAAQVANVTVAEKVSETNTDAARTEMIKKIFDSMTKIFGRLFA